MRVRGIWAAWAAVLTAAWMLALWAEQGQGLVAGANGESVQWAWLLRRDLLLLTGVWSLGMLSLTMWLALRQPWMERPLGGMDQVYRLHKWLGTTAAVAAVMHWIAKESSAWIKTVWGTAGRPARDAMLPWLAEGRSWAKDLGEWAFYALLLLVALTLWRRLLPYKPWRWLHRVMPVLYGALVFHSLVLLPQAYWQQPVGWLMGALMVLGSAAALWALAGRIGRARRYAAQVHAVQLLGTRPAQDPLEVLCALPAHWPGHRAGQFVFVRWDAWEGAHPFTVASAPGACGQTADGRTLLRLVIKPLGDYTAQLHRRLHAGQAMQIEGPYGRFDGRAPHADGQAVPVQVWVAAGVGITPFLAWLEARQPGSMPHAEAPGDGLSAAHLHYCTRDAATDRLLPRVQNLCAEACPPVGLTVHDAAQGQWLRPQDLEHHGPELDLWVCGPQSLGDALQQGAQAVRAQGGRWRLHREAFGMR
ncbi:ferric reductase-like transmembrane domain-containing protein [Comamonas sp. CMM03]|uniref:ferredoxin reductase family protein n=1 Tax=Comamonas sp. CMM03 TaxID=2854781 RepID=UPI001C472DCB|nr:ferric reductase-like transmembrane domain-containing protein [Comamonas sp. CMM03]MBV7418161.1 ferric reductase-like transmembrane domain-containing protein [Comamonas sp. CMM03]